MALNSRSSCRPLSRVRITGVRHQTVPHGNPTRSTASSTVYLFTEEGQKVREIRRPAHGTQLRRDHSEIGLHLSPCPQLDSECLDGQDVGKTMSDNGSSKPWTTQAQEHTPVTSALERVRQEALSSSRPAGP